jgi:hypothetical protein
MVANKEDTREELAMMMETDHEGTLLDENLLFMDEPSCVQRWLSFEN